MWYRTIMYIVMLILSLLAAPLAAHAQQPAKVPRIGFLFPDLFSPCRSNSFAQGLRKLSSYDKLFSYFYDIISCPHLPRLASDVLRPEGTGRF